MTAYYCDPSASGANDGTSWADAWDGSVSGSALQDAIDGANGTAPAAGDVVYCKGTDSISAAIDMDGNSGSYAAGHIKFIGVNAATTNAPPQASDYGEYFTIDGGNNTINGIDFGTAGADFIWLENIKITQCDGTAAINCGAAASDYCVFNNVWCHDNAAWGMYLQTNMRWQVMYRCRLTSNTSGGVYRPHTNGLIAFCEFIDNTGRGVDASVSVTVYGCVFHNNSTVGLFAAATPTAINCIFDGNGDYGMQTGSSQYSAYAIGCRFTNHPNASEYGWYSTTGNAFQYALNCYFGNNNTPASAEVLDVAIDGAATTTLTGSDSDDAGGGSGGYVNSAANDFNLSTSATLRSEAVTLD